MFMLLSNPLYMQGTHNGSACDQLHILFHSTGLICICPVTTTLIMTIRNNIFLFSFPLFILIICPIHKTCHSKLSLCKLC